MATGGGGPLGPHRKRWADVLGSNIPTSWNKNVLEILLEKDDRGAFLVSDVECAKLMSKIGLEISSNKVDAVQICPNGRGVIFITLKNHVSIEDHIFNEIFEVSPKVRVINMKPAGKREVIVTLKGLHPNSKDQSILDYLGKFGKVVTTKVVHCEFNEGPLKGLKNGDRSYKLEIQPNTNIGTYHVLFGNKVTLRYQGQKQTCARCFENSSRCVGGGIAKKCEASGGPKGDFSQHILDMWEKIGHNPEEIEVASVYDDHGENSDQYQRGANFTPPQVRPVASNFKGVSIKNIPKETDHGEIVEFILKSGLPDNCTENIVINENGTVIVNNIENEVCNLLVRNIHLTKQFNKKLVCRGIIPMSPTQSNNAGDTVTTPVTSRVKESDQLNSDISLVPHLSPQQAAGEQRGGPSLTPDVEIGEVDAVIKASQLNRRKSVRDLVTDFSSCVSNASSSEEECVEEWTEGGDRRQRKKKRKPSSSPPQNGLVRKVPNNKT